jgi:DMSO reductase anchor subunit
MKPAFSVIFLTTLIGAGQGLFLALFVVQLLAAAPTSLLVAGAALSLALTGLGLLASFFHLGHPERAWRAATMWRTSWLSREVIALPLFMAGVFAWGFATWAGLPGAIGVGAITALLCAGLFICTAQIYASIRFLQEWATPLTLINYSLLGCASGTTLATALAALRSNAQVEVVEALVDPLAMAALALTALAWASRLASLRRNAGLRPKSTLQSAIGIRHPRIVQIARGFMGTSFATREFFHGRSALALQTIRRGFLITTFALPMLALGAGLLGGAAWAFGAAFAIQYLGLLAERWYFFAQANHPQNLYYQAMS